MQDFGKTILIGVVFDLTLAHAANGERNIDIIKNVLVKKILDDKVLSKIYVSHPDWQKLPREQGESTYYVMVYNEPLKFSIDVAIRNAVTLIGEYTEDCEKYILIFTDRFQAPINYQYRKGFLVNEIHGYSTKICAIGIGDDYDKITLQSIIEECKGKFLHIADASLFENELVDLFQGE